MTFLANRRLKATAAAAIAASLLVAPAAMALDLTQENVTMPVRGEVYAANTDIKNAAPGRDSFLGLICHDNERAQTVNVRGVMDMANVWKKWTELKNKAAGMGGAALFPGMKVTGNWKISAIVDEDIDIDETHFNLQDFTRVYNEANPEFSQIMIPVKTSVEGKKFIVDFNLKQDLTAGEIEDKKAAELSVPLPTGSLSVVNNKIVTDDNLQVTDITVVGDFTASATGVPIVNTITQPIHFQSEAADPIIINRHGGWAIAPEFKSATEGKQLPNKVLDAMPEYAKEFGTFEALIAYKMADPKVNEVKAEDGTWKFLGWSAPERTTSGYRCGGYEIIGKWEFTEKAKPEPKPEPKPRPIDWTILFPSTPVKDDAPQSTVVDKPADKPADKPVAQAEVKVSANPKAPALAKTGANASTLVLAAGVVVLLGGAGLYFARRNG